MKTLFTSGLVVGLATTLLFTVEKTGSLVDQSKVTYNQSDDKKLNGSFTIHDKSNVLRLRGNYTDNKRSGDWYAFDSSGKLVLRYNYNVNKLLSLDQSSITSLEIKILDKDEEVANNARIPLPICSVEQYKNILIEELKDQMPPKERAEKASVDAEFLAMIDANGLPKYVATYSIKGIEYKTNLFIKDKLFNIEWLPARYNDKNYKSEVRFSASFEMDPATAGKRFIWNY